MNPFISIIVPVYNVEKYVEECLNSLIQQEFPRIEIILVIDGSPDGSAYICDKYMQKDDHIIIINQRNKGVAKARNIGLLAATGAYVHFVDPDDRLHSSSVYSIVYEHLKNCKIDVLIGKTTYYVNNFFNKVEDGKSTEEHYEGNCLSYILEKQHYFALTSGCNKIIKRKILRENKLFWPENVINEDDRWLPMVYSKCKNIEFINENIYDVRRREESLCSTVNPDRMIARGKEYLDTVRLNLSLLHNSSLTGSALGVGIEYYIQLFFSALKMIHDNGGNTLPDLNIIDEMKCSSNTKMQCLYLASKVIGRKGAYSIMKRRYGIE